MYDRQHQRAESPHKANDTSNSDYFDQADNANYAEHPGIADVADAACGRLLDNFQANLCQRCEDNKKVKPIPMKFVRMPKDGQPSSHKAQQQFDREKSCEDVLHDLERHRLFAIVGTHYVKICSKS
jgi:hypothetical protein